LATQDDGIESFLLEANMPEAHPIRADWSHFRQQMPVAQTWVYLDHAAVAPLPAPSREAIRQWCDEASETGDVAWPRWSTRVEEVRYRAAKLMAADPAEIAFVPNTTSGISLVAEGLPWRTGDNVVILANEFPSNQYAWMNLKGRGVQTHRVQIEAGISPINALLASCDDRTRLVAVSWVGYASGWRLDVADLVEQMHRRGILVLLDAIQGLGVFPLDVQQTGIDFVAADGHKWMLGPEGAGLLFVRREHLEHLRPLMVGWNSVQQRHNFHEIELNLRRDAARYEGGSANMVGLLGLGASLDLLAGLGLSATESPVAERVLALTGYAIESLQATGARVTSATDAQHRAGIVTFELPNQAADRLRQRCLDARIVLSCRSGRLRISPHAYNNEEDIDRLVEVIGQGE
jgi:cysteine desulfurase/selenocysteine lyase